MLFFRLIVSFTLPVKLFRPNFNYEFSIDVQVLISDIPSTVEPDETLCYVLIVTNLSSQTASNVVVTETYDDHFLLESSTPLPDEECNVWNLGDIPPNEAVMIALCGRVSGALPGEILLIMLKLLQVICIMSIRIH